MNHYPCYECLGRGWVAGAWLLGIPEHVACRRCHGTGLDPWPFEGSSTVDLTRGI